jgi:hypothetical protein
VMMITGVIYDITADACGSLFCIFNYYKMKGENVNNILFFIVIRFSDLFMFLFLVHNQCILC